MVPFESYEDARQWVLMSALGDVTVRVQLDWPDGLRTRVEFSHEGILRWADALAFD